MAHTSWCPLSYLKDQEWHWELTLTLNRDEPSRERKLMNSPGSLEG